MKKTLLLFLSFCLICTLAACKQPSIPPDTSSDNKNINSTSSNGEINSDYALKDISDERITIVDNKKFFNHLGIIINVPKEWRCLELNGEDGSSYFFRHPELSKKFQVALSVTGVEYLKDRTQKEYLDYLCDILGKDVKIDSFAKEKVGGYDSTKVVSSYSLENTNFIRIDYDNITVGVRLYKVTITYPASEKETLEPIFNSIMDSVEFKVN